MHAFNLLTNLRDIKKKSLRLLHKFNTQRIEWIKNFYLRFLKLCCNCWNYSILTATCFFFNKLEGQTLGDNICMSTITLPGYNFFFSLVVIIRSKCSRREQRAPYFYLFLICLSTLNWCQRSPKFSETMCFFSGFLFFCLFKLSSLFVNYYSSVCKPFAFCPSFRSYLVPSHITTLCGARWIFRSALDTIL